jgi:hypothetical protein
MPDRIVHETDYDDDAVVVDRGSGSSLGVMLGVLIVLLILAAVWWFALGPGSTTNGGSVNVNVPGASAAPGDNGGSGSGGNGANPTGAPAAS